MALDASLVGKESAPQEHRYGWKQVALYALGVGARVDGELDLLYEGRGPAVLPTYAVVPAFPVVFGLSMELGGDVTGVVHGGQRIHLHKPFAPKGTLRTVARIEGVYDLKRMAQAVLRSESRDESGELVAETEWSILYLKDGGFGGEPPPRAERAAPPKREPDFRFEQPTTPEQAALYRIAGGDANPLHIDPAVAQKTPFERPILHGLCTYGFVGRAVVTHVCSGDPNRLVALQGQFRKPVWPGDTLIVEGWQEGERVLLRATTAERPEEIVFGNAWATVR